MGGATLQTFAGNTLLTAALLCGEISSHPNLLEDPQHLSISNMYFGHPIACAAASGSYDAVKLILDRGAKEIMIYEPAFEVAAEKGYIDILQALWDAGVHRLTYGSQPDLYSAHLLTCAIRGSQLATVVWLFVSGWIYKEHSLISRQIEVAAMQGDEDIVRFLLANVLQTSGRNRNTIRMKDAAEALCRTPAITGILMEVLSSQSRDCCMSEAANRAASRGDLDTFIYLSSQRRKGRLQCTLKEAAKNGQYNVVKYILTKMKPSTVWPAMIVAAERGFDSVLRLLYRFGIRAADWKSVGVAIRDSLIAAKQFGHLNIVHTLARVSAPAIKHMDPTMAKELRDLVKNKTQVEPSTVYRPTSSPLWPVKRIRPT